MQFYYSPASSPCRAVMLLIHALNLQPEMKLLAPEKGDHLTPEYIKMNPQHTFPLLVDNGFVLSESRAILGYLADKYVPAMNLYPSEPMARAIVNQRLMFDLGTLYQQTVETYLRPLIMGAKKIDEKAQGKMIEALGWLEIFLGDAQYMAGDKMTIADFALTATISTIEMAGTDITPFPKISAWFNRMKMEIKNYDKSNAPGAKIWGDMVKTALNVK